LSFSVKAKTKIPTLGDKVLTEFASPERVRVPGESSRARASGVVVDNGADGIGAAAARTGIHALHADAGQGGTALGADQTFRTAVGRGSYVARQAGADANPVHLSLLAVRPAGVGIAGVQVLDDRFAG
jgi:hypothetical protein